MARRTRSKSTVSAHRPESSEPTRRVAVYTRRSTDEHQPYSIEAQTLRLDAYITSQPGWTKVASFSDNASAKDTHRPDLRAALAAARSGRIDVLWHAHLCRAVDVAAALAGHLAEDLGCKPAMICRHGLGSWFTIRHR